jgi:hypothetical protein
MKKTKIMPTTPTIKIVASDGIVWCDTCFSIRHTDVALSPTCACGGRWMLTELINIDDLSDDIKVHRNKIAAELSRHGLDVPVNVDVALMKADAIDIEMEKTKRHEAIMAAYRKADNAYYSAWSNGKIKDKKQKMPDDVKAMLKAKRNKLPQPKDLEPLMKVSLATVKKATPTGVRDLYFKVYGAEAGGNLTVERMRASIAEAIRELMSVGKMPSEPEGTEEREASQAALVAPNPPKAKRESAKKRAVYEDSTAQAEKEAKYPWAIKGSWRQDPEHPGSTILDIKCTLCGAARTIHLADLFQVKLCVSCRKSSKSKKA